MKNLFLTSSVNFVASDIAARLQINNFKLLFVLTPTEVKEGDLQWLVDDRNALVKAGFSVTDYTFTGKTRDEIADTLKGYDGIYMSGGNTFYFLQQIQTSNCADVIRDFVNEGKIYIGTSAGSIIAGPDIYPTYSIDSAEKAPDLRSYEGLGLVDFVIFPHWGSDNFRDRYLNQRLKHAYNTKNKIILLTNNQYILVEDDFYQIVEV